MSRQTTIRDWTTEFTEGRTVRGRWERENPRTSADLRFRHYVRIRGVRIRVPWIFWAMFS